MTGRADGAPATGAPVERAAHRRHVLSALSFAVALVVGELLIVAVTRAALWLTTSVLLAWVLSVVVVAVGGFVIFGLPVLRLFKGTATPDRADADPRGAWAERILRHGGRLAYVVASIVGGAPAVAWYFGSRGEAHAGRRALVASFLMAAFWCAFYLGLLSWL